jgi:hypothetical protein
MIVVANLPQDKPTFILNNVAPTTYVPVSYITQVGVARYVRRAAVGLLSSNISLRDSTSHQGPTVIGSVLGNVGLLLLLAGLACFSWRLRQRRFHAERIRLARLVPRMSISANSSDKH